MVRALPDLGLIDSEAVTVVSFPVERDDLGEPVFGEPERTEVPGCFVQPGATADLDATRPNGVSVAFTVYMSDPGFSLRGCAMEVRGRRYEVVGDPHPSTPENVPGGRNLQVEVTRSDG